MPDSDICMLILIRDHLNLPPILTVLVIGPRFDCRDDKFRNRVLEMILD